MTKHSYTDEEINQLAELKNKTPVPKKRTPIKLNILKVSELGRRLIVNLAGMKNFSEAQAAKFKAALVPLEDVVNSVQWRTAVYAKTFTTTSKTSKQVYDHIMTGREVLAKGVDYDMNISVELYEENSNTIGYTYSNSIWTWINNHFFKRYTSGQIAANVMHEWLHKLGYNHSSATDYSSVPYSLGYLMNEMVDDYLKGKQFTNLYPTVVKLPDPQDPDVKVPVVVPSVPRVRVCKKTWYTLWLGKICWYE